MYCSRTLLCKCSVLKRALSNPRVHNDDAFQEWRVRRKPVRYEPLLSTNAKDCVKKETCTKQRIRMLPTLLSPTKKILFEDVTPLVCNREWLKCPSHAVHAMRIEIESVPESQCRLCLADNRPLSATMSFFLLIYEHTYFNVLRSARNVQRNCSISAKLALILAYDRALEHIRYGKPELVYPRVK